MQTPKMSLRRNNILAAYKSIIDQMYKAPGKAQGEIQVCVCVEGGGCVCMCV
jgi:hypothetical protein